MVINGARFPFVFRTWSRIGRNYVVQIGFHPMWHEWGFSLDWGCQIAMGATIQEGDRRFADRVRWTVPVVWAE